MEEKIKKQINKLFLFGKKEDDFTAEKAWIESTYGENTYKSIEQRIKSKQNYIKNIIEDKSKNRYNNTTYGYSVYKCVVDIEEDLADYIDIIFEPFVKGGFSIINLSERVEEIDEPHFYLISWKNAFKKNNNITNKKEITLIEE